MTRKWMGLTLCALLVAAVTGCDLLNPGDGDNTGDETNNLAYTLVSSDISADTTWLSGKTYVIRSTPSVNNNAQLTIQPGVIIKFEQNAGLEVSAGSSIVANGTASNNIIFTAANDSDYGETVITGTPVAGYWEYIWIYDATGSQFRYCQFLYGGNTYATLYTGDKVTPVENCVFAHNKTIALDAGDALSDMSIKSNTFAYNSSPIKISTCQNSRLSDANVFSLNNTYDAILVDGVSTGFDQNNLGCTVDWQVTNVAYVLDSGISVNDNCTLRIYQNVTVKFKANHEFSFSSVINNLLVDSSAVFTSYKDDAYGGDSDGSTQTPNEADWTGIWDKGGSGAYVTNITSPAILYDDNTYQQSWDQKTFTFTAP